MNTKRSESKLGCRYVIADLFMTLFTNNFDDKTHTYT